MSHPDGPSKPYIPPNPQSPEEERSQEYEREQMSLAVLRLFSTLRVFCPGHWPTYLMMEKMEEVSRERQTRTKYSDSQKPGYELWKCAQMVLRHWMMQRYEERGERVDV